MPHNLGMVHGRFQPFHREHLSYVLRALDRCQNLVIGITNPDHSEHKLNPTSVHRHLAEANPFTYFQRVEMVRQSLAELDIDLRRVSFVPFHIFDPSKWAYYLPNPKATVQYVRIFSAWEEEKFSLFKAHGFAVEVLDRGATKAIEGTQVRHLMRTGSEWRELVPKGTANVIDMIDSGLL